MISIKIYALALTFEKLALESNSAPSKSEAISSKDVGGVMFQE